MGPCPFVHLCFSFPKYEMGCWPDGPEGPCQFWHQSLDMPFCLTKYSCCQHALDWGWRGNTQGLSEVWPWCSTHVWWFSIFVAFQGGHHQASVVPLTVSLPLFHYNYYLLNIYSVLDTLHISSNFYSHLAKHAYLTFYTRGNGLCEVKLSKYVVQISRLVDSNSLRF